MIKRYQKKSFYYKLYKKLFKYEIHKFDDLAKESMEMNEKKEEVIIYDNESNECSELHTKLLDKLLLRVKPKIKHFYFLLFCYCLRKKTHLDRVL